MQTLIVILNVTVGVALLLGYFLWLTVLNRRSGDKYEGFQPVNWRAAAASTVYTCCLVVGIFVIDKGGGIPPWPWPDAFLWSESCNGLVIASIGGIIALGQFVYIFRRTSFLTALGAWLILLIAGLFFFTVVLFILFVVVLIIEDKQQDRRRRY